MVNNLHEFSLLTQTWEYVVGILGLLLFVPLWKAVNPYRKSDH